MPFKTYNFRNDLSLIKVLSTDICYSEETLALTLIFALKMKWIFLTLYVPDHTYSCVRKPVVRLISRTVTQLKTKCVCPFSFRSERTREGEVMWPGIGNIGYTLY